MQGVSDPEQYLIGVHKNAKLYAELDALDRGETWEVADRSLTTKQINGVRYWFQLRRPGKQIRAHTTTRGVMFVRTE